MKTPKPYISYSQLSLWQRDPEEYRRQYFYGEKWGGNKYTDFGSEFAKAQEDGSSDDPIISTMLDAFPVYPAREHQLTVQMRDVHSVIHLLAKFDGLDEKAGILGEFKTGKNWNAKMANGSEQLKFYNLMWLIKTGRPFKEVRLHWLQTIEEDGELKLTGRHQTFLVKHTTVELLVFKQKVKRIVHEISEAYQLEISKI